MGWEGSAISEDKPRWPVVVDQPAHVVCANCRNKSTHCIADDKIRLMLQLFYAERVVRESAKKFVSTLPRLIF